MTSIELKPGDRVHLNELGASRCPKIKGRTGVVVALSSPGAELHPSAFYSMGISDRRTSIALTWNAMKTVDSGDRNKTAVEKKINSWTLTIVCFTLEVRYGSS
jgi:hypothetical protein